MPQTPPKPADRPKFDDETRYWVKGKTLNDIYDAIKRGQPLAGRNMVARQTDAGVILDSTAVGGGDGGDHPWKPSRSGEGVIVSENSILFGSSLSYLDRIEVLNLGTVIPVEPENKIWLDVVFGVWPAVNVAFVTTEANGGEWGDGEIESDGFIPPMQKRARRVLATVNSLGEIFPLVRNHLTLDYRPEASMQVLVPVVL